MGDRIKLRSDPLPPPKGREVRVLTAAISTLPPPAHSPPSPLDEKQRKLKLSPTAVGGAFLKGPGASAATPSSPSAAKPVSQGVLYLLSRQL